MTAMWAAVTLALGAINARYAWRARPDRTAMLVPGLMALLCCTSVLWTVTR